MTDQEREEFEFRLRAEQEAEQAKDGVSKFEEYTGVSPSSPLLGGAVGVVAGIPAGRILEGAAKGATAPLPRTTVAGKTGASSGDKWLRNYANINKPNFSGGVPEAASIYQRTKGHGPVSEKVTQRFGPGAKLDIESYSRAQKARPFMERVLSKTPEAVQRAGQAISGAGASVPAWMARGIAGGSAGFQGVDAANRFEQGDYLGAAIGGLGALGSGAALIPHPLTRGLGTAVGTAAPFINEYLDRRRKRQEEQPEESAEGVFGFSEGGGTPKKRLAKAFVDTAVGKTPKALEDVINLFKPKETKVMRASEALAPHIDKYLGITQTDNFGVHGGRKGGNRFPNFQNISPLHAKDRVVWMNDAEKHANDMANRSKINGIDTIWTTYIGAPDQLKSNKTVTKDIYENFLNKKWTPEQIYLINQGILTAKKGKDKGLIFPQSFDIRDKFAVQELGMDTFDRRAALASMLGEGKGLGGRRSGFGLENYEDILRSHRDPLTEGAPTSSVGTRLFSVDPTPTRFSKEYHPDYNYPVFGEDMGVQFERLVPQKLIVPEWYARTEAKSPGANRTHGNAWYSYMKDPQRITHELLMGMDKEGFKKGGLS